MRTISLSATLMVVILAWLPSHALASASFYLSPSSGSYSVGGTVTASVMIDSGGQAINAGEGDVSYSSDILEYQSVSTSGSIFTFWTNGPSGSDTKVSFGGGLSNPGYSGSAGKVLTITWKAKKAGSAIVTVSGSKILANDGSGTNVYSGGGSAKFTIGASSSPAPAPVKKGVTAPAVSSSTHPDQSKWYPARTIDLSWSSSGAKGFVYGFDQSGSTDPSGADSLTTSHSYDATADGIWYFHVKAKIDSGFSGVTDYQIHVDSTVPDPFEIKINGSDAFDPAPKASFSASDATSGIDHYDATIDGGAAFTLKNDDRLPKQKPGTHTLVVKAVDRAGNTREATLLYTIEGISAPVILEWTNHASLLNPIEFLGRSASDDVIHVFLNGKEIESFKAGDKKIGDADASFNQYSSELPAGEILWRYRYSSILYPGKQTFRFSRTAASGAESGLTDPYVTDVNASVIKIGNHIIPTIDIIMLLLTVILILFVLALLFWVRLRFLAAMCATPFLAVASKSRQYFDSMNKKIEHNIEKDIPSGAMTKDQVSKSKAQLEHDIHELVEAEQKRIEEMGKKRP